jgi:hypothetical protein
MSMTTTLNTNTNTNAKAPVAAAVDDHCDCGTAYATSADLCAPYIITLEEARKERQEEERSKQLRTKWGGRLENAALRACKRARVAGEVETDDAVRAAAMRARSVGHLDVLFDLSRNLEGTRLAPLVEECLDDLRERAQQRGWAPRAPHWKKSLPEGILASAAMQPYLRRWAAADAAAAVEEGAAIAPF